VAATVTPTFNRINPTSLDPFAFSFVPRFASTPPPTALYPRAVVRSPSDPDSSTLMVAEEVPMVGEFELDEDTQLSCTTRSRLNEL